jgi:prevent-host-death family protein
MDGMAQEIPVTQARAEFAELVNRVVYGGERIVVTRHGRAIVALVSADDLARLEQLERPGGQPTAVRLTGGAVTQPAPGEQPPQTPGRYDVAARHQPPGGGTGGAGGRPGGRYPQ